MPDEIFSSARLRAYRVLEAEGLGSATDFQILNTVASARLWIPLSLIEIAFRNAVDTVLTSAHPARGAWLCDAEGEDIDWGRSEGREIFRRSGNGQDAKDAAAEAEQDGAGAEDDDAPPDPVAFAARMAARHGRPVVTRDDVVAHLMLGFWVFRGPAGLLKEDPKIDVYALLADHFGGKFGSATKFKELMTSDILLTRNRVAHHEPVLLRGRYIFDKKTGKARAGNDLVTSLQGAVGKFERLVQTVVDTAKAMAPMAEAVLDSVAQEILADTAPLAAALDAKLEDNKAATEVRRAERRAAYEREHGEAGT